jgi:recombination protein RecA
MEEKENPGLKDALAKLKKQYGEGAVLDPGAAPAKVEVLPTGCYAVDRVLDCGGLPRGRILEVFGQESSGKSTFCLFLIAQVQKAGGKCVFIDAEHAFDSHYATSIGVDMDKLLVAQPATLEETFDTLRALAETNEVDLIVVDSVAALTPKVELEGEEMLKDSVAIQARLMSKALRICTGPISRSKTVAIFINQLRDNVGIMYGKKEVTPGGKALKFYSSVRLQINKGDKIVGEDKGQIGNVVNITAVKNKVGFPWKKASFDLYYGSGVDLYSDAFDTAVELGIITRKGNTYEVKETKLGVGRDAARKVFREDKAIYNETRKHIDKELSKRRQSRGSGGAPEKGRDK